MKKTFEIIKPERITLVDQLRGLEVGQEVEIDLSQYKVSSIRQAANRLKLAGIILTVSERGQRYKTKVKRMA